MPENPKAFIDLLESKHLLAPEIVTELRRQVQESKARLTPELLAKLLVDNGHLTRFQATKLIAEYKEQVAADDQRQAELDLAADSAATDVEEELGFAPEPERSVETPSAEEPDVEIASVFIDDEEESTRQLADVESAAAVKPESPAKDTAARAKVVEALPVDDSQATEPEETIAPAPPRPKKAVRPAQPSGSPWDSFRILGVGLILALVLVAGYFLLNWFIRGNADDRLARANDSYESRSYETAAAMYFEFAEDFPASENVSFARVRAALSTLRNDSEGAPDPEIGLDTALEVLPSIVDEAALNELRSEVAGVLIALAGKFNERADASDTIVERKHLMDRMDSLMELIIDPRFVGANERNQQAPTLDRIEEDRKRIQREILRDEQFAATLETIDDKLADEDTVAAYAARQELIDEYPLLEAREDLQARVKRASEIQKTLVQPGNLRPRLLKPQSDSQPAQTQAIRRTVVLGHTRGAGAEKLRGQVVFVKVKGSVYGLDAATGEILWRRKAARGYDTHPLRLGETSAVDALICDSERGRLLRVAGTTGETLWTVELGTHIHAPVVEGEDLFVACRDGHVVGLDLETGQTKWVSLLPQPAATSPGVAYGKPLYVAGEHSNLYVISRSNGQCQEVFYTGHRADAVAVPPELLLGQLFLIENVNAYSAKIRILSVSEAGTDLQDAQVPILLDGNVLVPPQVDGRRMAIQTDLGQIMVLDVEPTLETQKVSELASIPKNLLQPRLAWSVFSNNQLWVADSRFTRFNLQVSLGKLARAWTVNDGDTFFGPPQKLDDDTLVHIRTLRGNQGNRVAAVDADSGRPKWETDLGVPVSLVHEATDGQLEAVTSNGMVFALDDQETRSKANADPGGGRSAMNFQSPVFLTPSVAILFNKSRRNQFAVYADREGGSKLLVLSANFGSGSPTCNPVPVGRRMAIGLDNGQLNLFDPSNGSAAAAAYQPAVQAGQKVRWNAPVYLDDSQTLVAASSLLKLVRLSTGEALRPLTERQLELPLMGPLCKLGGDIAAVRSTPSDQKLLIFDALSLEQKGEVQLNGSPVAGPYRAPGGCLLQTADELVSVTNDGQLRWTLHFPDSLLTGPPVDASGRILLASRSGKVWLLDPETGETVGAADTGQTLSSSPIITSESILVGTDDGAAIELTASLAPDQETP